MSETHQEQARRMTHSATLRALAHEFCPDMPATVLCVSLAVGVSANGKDEAYLTEINKDLKPILERMNNELKAFAHERGIAYSGAAAASLGLAAFPDDETRAKYAKEVLPLYEIEAILGALDGEDSFEA